MFEILFFIGLLEEGEDFTEFRNRVVELIKDVVFIVGSANVFKHMFAFLATCHQNNSWESSEAALFIMVSLGLGIKTILGNLLKPVHYDTYV